MHFELSVIAVRMSMATYSQTPGTESEALDATSSTLLGIQAYINAPS